MSNFPGERRSPEYQYDGVGNRTAVIDANTHATTFIYDAANRETSEKDAIGNETDFGYDGNGNITSRTDSKGKRTLVYDKNNRLVEEDLPDGKKQTYVYDFGGRETQATDWNGTYQFEYDGLNRVTKRVLPDGKFIHHDYDPAGNETARTDYLGGAYKYVFDALNRPVQETDTLGGVTGILYDKTNHIKQYHYPNNTSCTYTYDSTYDIKSVVNKKDSGEVFTQFGYQYDPVGNRTSVTDNIGETTYTYDNANWLTEVDYPDRDSVSYTYDPVGNRLSMTVGSQVTNYTYNDANMILTAGNETFTFDGNGNMTQRTDAASNQTTTYVYDTENRLVQATLPDGSVSKFGYDHTNMRISEDVPNSDGTRLTKQFFWSGNDVVNESTPDEQVTYNVLRNINLSKTTLNNCCPDPTAAYYHFDGLGSIADVTDAGANVVNNYRYDTFGQTLSGGQGKENDLQFVGALGLRNQANIGLTYMRNRWYADDLGRFLTKDPSGFRGGINVYIYVHNNPFTFLDFLGLCDLSSLMSSWANNPSVQNFAAGQKAFYDQYGYYPVPGQVNQFGPVQSPSSYLNSDLSIDYSGIAADYTGLSGQVANNFMTGAYFGTGYGSELADWGYSHYYTTGDPMGLFLGNVGTAWSPEYFQTTAQVLNLGLGVLTLGSSLMIDEPLAVGAGTLGLGGGGIETTGTLSSSDILFSQGSVNTAKVTEYADYMAENGWGTTPSIDTVLTDNGLVTVDNNRLLAASWTDTPVQATIHLPGETLPDSMVERFGDSTTWGEALQARIANQSASYQKIYPSGSWTTGFKGTYP